MKIQMVDLHNQYVKIKNEIDSNIQEVINNTQFIKGPQIKQFEEALAKELEVKHVIACANGTDALQIAMMALDLKPGDEIILPVFTYVATAEVIALLGLTPVMVDVDPNTFCIDVNLIASKISVRTKAIVPVHLFGQCANMDAIMEIANKHNLFVIEDTAQAIGALYRSERREARDEKESRVQNPESRQEIGEADGLLDAQGLDSRLSSLDSKTNNLDSPELLGTGGFWTLDSKSAGTIGHIGTTSFFPSKNLGCYGDGGALMTNDDELAKKIRMICNHGQSVQYVHDIIGVNSRLDSIQAAVLNAKLPHLKSYTAARNEAASWYDEMLSGHPNIIIPKRNPNSTHVFHQYTIRIQDKNASSQEPAARSLQRDQLRKLLSEKGIPSMVYYPIELHKQKAFEKYWDGVERFPVSEELVQTVLSLPMHTEMTREMVGYVCETLVGIMNDEL
ncbi:MAG: DegT/DnrJ/EryC1/StrS family aminotransferase [Bacteroidota bacterium]|nr:DegT/DnrJ/EryC1/StrS family aminotransferase [Bacteroidota bacterium]